MKVDKGQSIGKRRHRSALDDTLEIDKSCQIKSCHCRHLEVDQIGNSAIRSADPENRTL